MVIFCILVVVNLYYHPVNILGRQNVVYWSRKLKASVSTVNWPIDVSLFDLDCLTLYLEGPLHSLPFEKGSKNFKVLVARHEQRVFPKLCYGGVVCIGLPERQKPWVRTWKSFLLVNDDLWFVPSRYPTLEYELPLKHTWYNPMHLLIIPAEAAATDCATTFQGSWWSCGVLNWAVSVLQLSLCLNGITDVLNNGF